MHHPSPIVTTVTEATSRQNPLYSNYVVTPPPGLKINTDNVIVVCLHRCKEIVSLLSYCCTTPHD